MTKALCRRRTGNSVPRAEKFGDMIRADLTIPNEEGESRNNHRYAIVVQDLAIQWIHLRKFLKPSEKPKVIYTEYSLVLANPVKI